MRNDPSAKAMALIHEAARNDGTLNLLAYVAEMEGIVKDLAAYSQRYEGSALPCQMCSGIWGDHQESCPWRRAVAARDGMEGK